MTYKVGDYVYVRYLNGLRKKIIVDKARDDKDAYYVCSIDECGKGTGPFEFVRASYLTPANSPITTTTSEHADRKNDGKPQLTLLPFDCLAECAKVLMQAKAKYPDQANGKANWEKLWGKDTPKITLDSALRHITARLSGEVRDKESGHLHAAHAAVNLLFLIRHELEEATK